MAKRQKGPGGVAEKLDAFFDDLAEKGPGGAGGGGGGGGGSAEKKEEKKKRKIPVLGAETVCKECEKTYHATDGYLRACTACEKKREIKQCTKYLVERYDRVHVAAAHSYGLDGDSEVSVCVPVKLGLHSSAEAAGKACEKDLKSQKAKDKAAQVENLQRAVDSGNEDWDPPAFKSPSYTVTELRADHAHEPKSRIWPTGKVAKRCEQCLNAVATLYKHKEDGHKRCADCQDITAEEDE